MNSLMSFPDRGPWGDSRWRGNCSGHVIREIIDHFRPQLFVDACEGSGTSREVCLELGVQYVGLDLHQGQDFTQDMILDYLPRRADVVFTHPPYADLIDYGQVGTFSNAQLMERDLSRKSVDEFLELSQTMLFNQRLATREGGIYCTLIGDLRRGGTFRSFQADYLGMMPKEELVAVVVKAQHHCVSDTRSYHGDFIPIRHEYLLLWRKTKRTMLAITLQKVQELSRMQDWSWRNLVRLALMNHGGQADLGTLYRTIGQLPEAEGVRQTNRHWPAKVRQILQRHFEPVSRGVWALAA